MWCILLWHCFVMQLQIICKAGGSLLCQVHGGWHDVTFAALGTGCNKNLSGTRFTKETIFFS